MYVAIILCIAADCKKKKNTQSEFLSTPVWKVLSIKAKIAINSINVFLDNLLCIGVIPRLQSFLTDSWKNMIEYGHV